MAGENDKLTAEQIARLAAEVGLGQAASRALQGVVNKTQAYEMNQQRMQSIAADPTYAAFTTGIGGRPPLSVSDPNNSQLVDRYHRLEEMMTRAANVNSTIDEKARQRAMEAVGHDIKSRMSESQDGVSNGAASYTTIYKLFVWKHQRHKRRRVWRNTKSF